MERDIKVGMEVDFYPSNHKMKEILKTFVLGYPFDIQAYNFNLEVPLKAIVVHINKEGNYLFHGKEKHLDLKVFYGTNHKYVTNCSFDRNERHLNQWNYKEAIRPEYESVHDDKLITLINANDRDGIITLNCTKETYKMIDGKLFKGLDDIVPEKELEFTDFLAPIDKVMNRWYEKIDAYKVMYYKILNGGQLDSINCNKD